MFFAHRIIEMSNCAPAAVRRGADRLGAKGVGGMRFTKTLRFRLIVVTVLCTAAVSLVGNLALFGYLNNILTQRADRIDEIYLSTLQNQLDEYLTDLSDLAILCSSDYTVSRALSPAATMKNAVDAQDRLNAYLATSSVQDYIDVLSVVNGHGVVAAATTQTAGDLHDYGAICAQEVYRQAVEGAAACCAPAWRRPSTAATRYWRPCGPSRAWAAARGRGICTWSCSWPCLTRYWPPTPT